MVLTSKLTKNNRPGFSLISKLLLLGCLLLSSSFSPPKTRSYAVATVVIDAGHGGHDSGCLGGKVKEKDVALSVALKLGNFIEEHFPDVKVIYTRKTDVFVELHERAAIANNARADLFICIHCNSACYYDKKKKKDVCNGDIEGAETWVMGLHKSEANLEVAKRENEVVLLEKDYTRQYDGFDPNSPEANIIFSLYQNTFLDQSLKLASTVQQELRLKGRASRGVKQAGFLVLFKTAMPSILIETGFLSNPWEQRYLGSEKGQREVAQGIFNAFKSYKNSVEASGIRSNDVKEENAAPEEKSSVGSNDTATNEIPVSKQPEVEISKPAEKEPEKKEPEKEKIEQVVNTPVKVEKAKPAASIPQKQELSFGVQFLSSPEKLPRNSPKFKGLKNVSEDKEKGVYKYVEGKVNTMDEAIVLQDAVRKKGFKDAFVVAYLNNKKISIKEAREILQKK